MKAILPAISAFAYVFLVMPAAQAASTATTNLDGAAKSLENVGSAYGANTGGEADLTTLIGKLISVLLGIMGILLVVYIVWAGFIYATAQDDSKKTQKAKDMLKNAIIGLVFIVAAYAIASYVISAITSVTA